MATAFHKSIGKTLLKYHEEGKQRFSPRVERLLQPLEDLSSREEISSNPILTVFRDRAASLPRYLFIGPRGGKTIKLGIFGGFHGNTPATAEAVVDFARHLVAHDELARGYVLYLYPVVNPFGFEHKIPETPSGRRLEEDLWKETDQPEAYLLEREVSVLQFDGVISLFGSSETRKVQTHVRSRLLHEEIARPAAEIANLVIEGWVPVDQSGHNRPLAELPSLRLLPPSNTLSGFELSFLAPVKVPRAALNKALSQGLIETLQKYREFISHGQHL